MQRQIACLGDILQSLDNAQSHSRMGTPMVCRRQEVAVPETWRAVRVSRITVARVPRRVRHLIRVGTNRPAHSYAEAGTPPLGCCHDARPELRTGRRQENRATGKLVGDKSP